MGVKISELTSMGTLAGTEKLAGVDAVTQYTTPADLKTYIAAKYAKISDTKTTGTDGGTFTSGAWQTRDINTEDSDSSAIVSISANQFTLAAGTYRILARAPAYGCELHKAKMYNVTDAADTLIGSAGQSDNSGNGSQSDSIIQGEFTIAGTKTFEMRHRCSVTYATSGFGRASSFSATEVYTVVEIWKVA